MSTSKEEFDELMEIMALATPLTENDIHQIYLQGQIKILERIKNKITGHPVNGIVRGIVDEFAINELLKDKWDELARSKTHSA